MIKIKHRPVLGPEPSVPLQRRRIGIGCERKASLTELQAGCNSTNAEDIWGQTTVCLEAPQKLGGREGVPGGQIVRNMR